MTSLMIEMVYKYYSFYIFFYFRDYFILINKLEQQRLFVSLNDIQI